MRLFPLPASLITAIAAAALLAGCATTPSAEVTRFHLGQPIPADSIAIVPPPGVDASNLEFRSHADAIAPALASAGFRPVPQDGSSAYIAVIRAEQAVRDGPPRSSGLSIGLGGGSFSGGRRGGVGLGGGVNIPVGGNRPTEIRTNRLSIEIRRRSDNSNIWEGRAAQDIAADAPAASLNAAVPVLARAILSDFPGKSGQTVVVKTK